MCCLSGRLIVDGFFSSDKDILVPVKRSPSDIHLSLIPSTEAFLSNSKHIERFLPVPLVPFEIGKNDFLKTLKRRNWIEEINNQIILVKIHQTILSFDEFLGLLRWLCTNDINQNKSYIKQILSKIRYRQIDLPEIIKLENIEYYDTLNIRSLPLPPSVLPSTIVSHISREDLQKRLSLSLITPKTLIQFYLTEDEHYLFLNEDSSIILLSFISQHLNQFNQTELNQIKDILSSLKCIRTTKGMKIPNESYLRSTNLNSDLSIIKFYIPQIETNDKEESNEYPISIDLVKLIGCRTISLPKSSNQISEDHFKTNETFIEDLLKQRKSMSINDINALKDNQWILGTRFKYDKSIKIKCKPSELHFPSVGERLQWNELLILDWKDLDIRSREYAFLKELGVKEVPDLNKLILRIEEEHLQQSKNKSDYKLPNSLLFFAEHFEQHYSKWWKNVNIKTPFLPSSTEQSDQVILSTPQSVFKELNPLFPSLLPSVIRCFSLYIDIGLIGVKPRPTISMAFNYLIEKRNELLTVQTAPIYFSYLNKLDGINKTFIQNISNIQFIPLTGDYIYVKPSEVFIRSKSAEDDLITSGLIDYIDYGLEANSFLTTIGVLSYPRADNLANLLIQRQENYFKQTNNQNEELIQSKLRFYTNCLKQLSLELNLTKQLNCEPIKTRLRTKPWCLSYQIIQLTNENKQTIFKIVKPEDVYLDDDHQSAIDIKPLCAPDEPELIQLYQTFGAKWLSENVQRTLIHRGKVFSTERTKKLFDLIHHRLDMLFVNNRGERLENLDSKRFQLLKTNFSVYESEGIQCQIYFQNKTITLNSSECSSCAIEFDKKKVMLYIQKDIQTLDYIDISTELTRFVYKKVNQTLVHSISDKLSSPLETLKRRGIPVDRLLKIQQQQPINLTLQIQQTKTEDNIQQQQQQIPQQQQQQQRQIPQQQEQQLRQERQIREEEKQQLQEYGEQVEFKEDYKSEQLKQSEEPQRGFFQSLKDLLVPLQFPSSSVRNVNNPIETNQSEVLRDRIENFGLYKSVDDNDINRMISTSRPYSQREFNQSSSSRHEVNNSCEYLPKSSMIRYENLLHGIPLFIDTNVRLTNIMIDQGKQLAYLLSSLAQQVFYLPVETMHLFRDLDSARIAFNSNGSLFFNLRYFEQVFGDDMKLNIQNGSLSSSTPIIRRIVNFYYMVTCHELSHNIDSNHDLNFINRLERVSVRFMDAKDTFISKFSF